jgi:hypothetical protein
MSLLDNSTISPKPAEQTRFLAHGIRSRVGHTLPTTAAADGASSEEQQDECYEYEPEACKYNHISHKYRHQPPDYG